MNWFQEKKTKILQQLSVPDDEYLDSSPKGTVDQPIRDLVDEINSVGGLVTTSSCSGRLAVFLEGPSRAVAAASNSSAGGADADSARRSAGGKGGGRWLFTSHEPLDLTSLDIKQSLLKTLGLQEGPMQYPRGEDAARFVHIKFEPMVRA